VCVCEQIVALWLLDSWCSKRTFACALPVVCSQETLGAAMPESMTDLQQLQSFFSAQPWRKGCSGILAFVFRTKAVSGIKAAASLPAKLAGDSRAVIVVAAMSRGSSQDALSDDSVSCASECKVNMQTNTASELPAAASQVKSSTAEEVTDIEHPSV
jgi:hypothetical protein